MASKASETFPPYIVALFVIPSFTMETLIALLMKISIPSVNISSPTPLHF